MVITIFEHNIDYEEVIKRYDDFNFVLKFRFFFFYYEVDIRYKIQINTPQVLKQILMFEYSRHSVIIRLLVS